MSRDSDQSHAVQVGWHLDLSSLVSDVRAEHVENIPKDPVFALALVVLASAFDQDALAELLAVPEEVLEGAARHLHTEARTELVRAFLKDVVTEARNPKGATE